MIRFETSGFSSAESFQSCWGVWTAERYDAARTSAAQLTHRPANRPRRLCALSNHHQVGTEPGTRWCRAPLSSAIGTLALPDQVAVQVRVGAVLLPFQVPMNPKVALAPAPSEPLKETLVAVTAEPLALMVAFQDWLIV
ncbi:hypothetical protein SAMN05443287_1175 [Micromonospora phaseoli]|uniref:Uncharacterized protein n=1 Tax=Micromonospora phaseoli TaxID=1144548 RepID=A0A1H7DS82_9ACTN|nr:hypothetical protein CLV64_108365 [Micromonospora phaseoli]SEK04603.1 hypothetical protein SAMN05443287_1175 [Micromonospora phaseoli]